MLFNSYGFLFVFLPATVISFHLAGLVLGRRMAMASLVAASLIFYVW